MITILKILGCLAVIIASTSLGHLLRTWPTEMANSVLEMLASISVIVATWFGLSTWRKETLGRRRMELAEDALAIFQEARDAIAYIRCSISWESEGQTRKPLVGEKPEETAALNQAYVTVERYLRSADLFAKLVSMRHRFVAHFGKSAGTPFETLRDVLATIRTSADGRARLYLQRVRGGAGWDPKTLSNCIQKEESVIWRSYGADDEIDRKINEAVEAIERICAPHLGQ